MKLTLLEGSRTTLLVYSDAVRSAVMMSRVFPPARTLRLLTSITRGVSCGGMMNGTGTGPATIQLLNVVRYLDERGIDAGVIAVASCPPLCRSTYACVHGHAIIE